jgi:hypothetical protein
MKVGFIGLGRMGQVMARRLVDGGHEVGVYNRTAEKMKPLTDRRRQGDGLDQGGGEFRRSGLHHAHRRRRGPRRGRSGRRDQGIAAERRRSHLRRHAQRRRHREAHGASCRRRTGSDRDADARPPRSRRRRPGRHGGRRAAAKRRAFRPLFAAIAPRVVDSGADPVTAAAIKIANNFVLGCAIEAMGEGFALTRKYGVKPETFYGVLDRGAVRLLGVQDLRQVHRRGTLSAGRPARRDRA